jgi:1,4-dihydroxy-2-naphthoate octaprenyltransferase
MPSPPLSIWLLAARPKTLPAAASPVLIGSALAIGDAHFALFPTLAAFFAALLIQIGTNFANDYFDFVKGTDAAGRLGPTRVTHAGLVTPAQMKRATAVVFGLALLIGVYLVFRSGWPILVIGLLSVSFGVLYTGGPYPLGYNGLGDIFVLIFFGPVAVAGTYFVNTHAWSMPAVIAGLVPGLFSVGILTVNNLRDIDNDRAGGKRTLPVRFGRVFARWEFLVCLCVAHGVSAAICITEMRWLGLVAVVTIVPAAILVRSIFRIDEGSAFNNALATTGAVLFLHSVLLSIGWILL